MKKQGVVVAPGARCDEVLTYGGFVAAHRSSALKRSAQGLRCTVVALLLCLLGGCSLLSLSYRHAPLLLTTWVDGYFDLDRAQRKALKQAMTEVHAWHRDTRLPGLARALEALAGAAMQPTVTPADLRPFSDTLRAEYHALSARLAPAFAVLAAELNAAQREHLAQALARSREEQAEEYLKPGAASLAATRLAWIEDLAEEWLGRLSTTQTDWLTTRLAEMPPDYRAWSAHRAARQHALLDAVSGKTPGAAMAAWLMAYESSRSPDYQAHVERMRDFYETLTTDLVNGASAEQRAHLHARLLAYRDDLLALHRLAGPAAARN